jgi:hypothetical protein
MFLSFCAPSSRQELISNRPWETQTAPTIILNDAKVHKWTRIIEQIEIKIVKEVDL